MKQFLILLLMCCTLSSAAKNLYYVELKIWKVDNLSLFNLKNERNAVSLDCRLTKTFMLRLKSETYCKTTMSTKAHFRFFLLFSKPLEYKL